MKGTKELTPAEYADLYGCSNRYIHWMLKENKGDKLPHVLKVKKYSRFYILEVPITLTIDSFKKEYEKK